MAFPAAWPIRNRVIGSAEQTKLMRGCITRGFQDRNCLKTYRRGLYEKAMFEHNRAQLGKLSDPVELRVAE